MKLGEHDGHVRRTENGFLALCSCGTSLGTYNSKGDAEAALSAHEDSHTLHGDDGGQAL